MPGEISSMTEGEAAAAEFAALAPPSDTRRCLFCGCTEDDCRGCAKRTAGPCGWLRLGPPITVCTACERFAGVLDGYRSPLARSAYVDGVRDALAAAGCYHHE